jgi:hypothetical protein
MSPQYSKFTGASNGKPCGTRSVLGAEDRVEDGLSTRRRRRKIIYLKQKKGATLDSALKESHELRKLGLKFE